MHNCDVWAEVDFGHGPVEIRCTKVGEHENHICAVVIAGEHPSSVPQISHNVFEKNET